MSKHLTLEHLEDVKEYIDTTRATTASVQEINAKIPVQATSSNQLADKSFVNSSIATETAHYISNNGEPFTSLEELEAYSGTVTNNAYAFVTGTDEQGNSYYDRYKATVSGSTVTWAKEFRLNNSSFTSVQWDTINSGITAEDKTTWDGKQDKITSTNKLSYNLMSGVAASSHTHSYVPLSGGTMTGTLTANVNAAGTSNKVYGAVFN